MRSNCLNRNCYCYLVECCRLYYSDRNRQNNLPSIDFSCSNRRDGKTCNSFGEQNVPNLHSMFILIDFVRLYKKISNAACKNNLEKILLVKRIQLEFKYRQKLT